MVKKSYLAKFIPNSITILSLCCGLSSIRFSIMGEWKTALFFILFAAILDFFDGWFAKKLKTDSAFGAELDSLSDVISFGVAPSLFIYLWTLIELDSLGWGIALFFVVCSALRLARFTADIYLSPKSIDSNLYFIGIPSPAAAGLSLMPVFIYFQFQFELLRDPYLNLVNIGIIGFLMISKIPTISLKKINFDQKYSPWLVIIIVFIFVGIFSNIWLTLMALAFLYILSIFYTVFINFNSK